MAFPLDSMKNTPESPELPPRQKSRRWAPSLRVTAVLAAGMLASGVAIGAAIGPAPSSSLAVGQLLPSLLPELLRAEERHSAGTQPPATSPQPTPTPAAEGETSRRHRRKRRHHRAAETSPSAEATPTTGTETTLKAPTPASSTKPKAKALPAVTKVWLIELGNSSFTELAAHPTDAPYLSTSAMPSGTLLSGWSALDGSAFANAAALAASNPPQLLDTIVQPPCPEGAAGTSCAPDTPGALSTADEFLKATLPTITSTSAYRENGLVVITFASIAQPTASGLPAGATTATLTSTPPAGVLLISPFVAAGASSTATFAPTSPKQSLEKLLRG
jgi:hypothetical protein